MLLTCLTLLAPRRRAHERFDYCDGARLTWCSDNTELDAAGNLIATSATLSGTVTATAGAIGGWTLGATALTSGSGATTVGLDSGGTNPAIYAGSATPGSAPFRVTNAGAVTASNIAITGGSIVLGAVTFTPSGLTIAPGTSSTFSSGTAYGYTVSDGDLGVFGWDSSSVIRSIALRNRWTGAENRPVTTEISSDFGGSGFTAAVASVSTSASSNAATISLITSQNGVPFAGVITVGGIADFWGTTATTVGAAGGASALPATPVGYIVVKVAGTSLKVPVYNT
jgi:hypothetical protein